MDGSIMRASAICLSLIAGCSASTAVPPPPRKASTGAGLTRELLQRGKTPVLFGDTPVPALRSDSVYATIAAGVDHGCLIATSGKYADQVVCWTSASFEATPVV